MAVRAKCLATTERGIMAADVKVCRKEGKEGVERVAQKKERAGDGGRGRMNEMK